MKLSKPTQLALKLKCLFRTLICMYEVIDILFYVETFKSTVHS